MFTLSRILSCTLGSVCLSRETIIIWCNLLEELAVSVVVDSDIGL